MRKDFKKRFLLRIDKRQSCWLWRGTITAKGYGQFWDGIRVIRAHRMSWLIHNGPIKQDMLVCHKCDVKLCVNPSHLFIGTCRDNNLDKMNKGRAKALFKNGYDPRRGKLTPDQADEIRRVYASNNPQTGEKGNLTKQLAEQFQIRTRQVFSIIHERSNPTLNQ